MTFYITTPIYYVNDRPHIGHVYTTTVADALARYHRLAGDDTFFLTGTDEHAGKVVDAAAERGLSPLDWATQNANVFKDTFDRLRITHNDFIRTTEARHTSKVTEYLLALLKPTDDDASGGPGGDVYPGTYEGWYDPGEEEYVPEARAREHGYKSPISGRDLVKRTEQNFYFRLSKYAPQVIAAMESGEFDVQPEARKNEIINRLKEAQDVPISREGKSTEQGGWGIAMPSLDGEPTGHTVYVWIDALFNYLTTVDADDRRKYWEGGATHLIAKDILWFHAAIWPAMLLALQKREGYEWVRLPKLVYAHSFWISEGVKMSKSKHNFIDLEKIDATIDAVGDLTGKPGEKASETGGFTDFGRGLDALRYFLCKDGPMGTTDADFAEKAFWETYNADLANTLGNSFNRVANMTHKYFEGVVQEAGESRRRQDAETPRVDLPGLVEKDVLEYLNYMNKQSILVAVTWAIHTVKGVDEYIEQTSPFKIAKDESRLPEVGAILYDCAEALRIASVLLWPVIPDACEKVWARLGLDYAERLRNRGTGCLDEWAAWGGLKPGTTIEKGDPLFPRYREP
ncbi:MAG: class I tRNA ligase family protein [Planctomycetota bacterium]